LTEIILFDMDRYRTPLRYGLVWLRSIERRLLREPLGVEDSWDGDYIRHHLARRFKSKPRVHLAVLEAALQHDQSGGGKVRELLDGLLADAGSVWTVKELNGTTCLVRRVSPVLEGLVEDGASTGSTSGQLLATAWTQAFGRNPHPPDAYRQAVRAIEAAAGPILSPKDPSNRTLGTMLANVRDAPQKWQFVLQGKSSPEESMLPVSQAMAMLWTSQYDRHVTEGKPHHVTQPEAEVAVTTAAIIVHWFESGAVRWADETPSERSAGEA